MITCQPSLGGCLWTWTQTSAIMIELAPPLKAFTLCAVLILALCILGLFFFYCGMVYQLLSTPNNALWPDYRVETNGLERSIDSDAKTARDRSNQWYVISRYLLVFLINY